MNSRTLKASVAFLIIGGLLLLIAGLTTSVNGKEFGSNAAANAAFICLAVALLNLIWWLLGGEPIETTLDELRRSVKLLEDSKATGAQRIVPVSGEFGSHGDWMDRLRSADKTIDLMGYTLHVWTRGANFEQELLKLIRKGVRIRILVMDPDSDGLPSMVNTDQIRTISIDGVREELNVVLGFFREIQSKLAPQHAQNLEIRMVTRGLIVCQICRTDDEMTVVSYLFSVVASHSPLTLIQGENSRLFRIYLEEFEQLWKLNPPATAP